DARKALKQLAERFDYCLGLAHERIDHEAGFAAGIIHHHDVFAFGGFSAHLEHFPEAQQRQHFATQIDIASLAEPPPLLERQFHAFEHRLERDDVCRSADPYQKAVDDRE